MAATHFYAAVPILAKWRRVVSRVSEGGNKGDVSSGLGRAVGGSCWRL